MKAPFLTGITALAILGTTVAHAEQSAEWKQLDRWDIRVDASMGNGCFMQGAYGATVVRFGIDHRGADVTGYVIIFNQGWEALTPGRNYDVQVRFDNYAKSGWSTWAGTAISLSGGTRALIVPFRNSEVWSAIAYGSAIHIAYQNRSLLDGNLPGSAEAFKALLDCQSNFTGSQARDPFIASGRSSDPFR